MKNENVKTIVWNDAAKAIVKTLADSDKPLTLAEINAISGVKVVAGNITSLVRQGVILNVGTTSVAVPSKRKVGTYAFITAEPQTNPANGKICNYTDTERAILATIKDADAPMTLAHHRGGRAPYRRPGPSWRWTGLGCRGRLPYRS